MIMKYDTQQGNTEKLGFKQFTISVSSDYAEISLFTNFCEYCICCELLSIFYCDLVGGWNNAGSWHGSSYTDPWPTWSI